MNRLKVLCHFLLLTSSASFQLYTLKSVPDEPSYIVVNHKEPFSIECKAQTLDDFHPAWFFTRDEWDRDPMDESCKFLFRICFDFTEMNFSVFVLILLR